ncbi:serine/threonine-protein kinase [Nannocystis pusilla]|uniref:Serine/threonine-protein kinase n=1 Tax=Nannocystis pusilla TaxID=889268 RepID=A0A9X3ETL7_9BACT|nr:serine/threonine-protein kinase [Nannocystis pusilla]MCY1005253.1 serine/threonine-protein kinase [Nannocystis pusilla]
MSPPDPSSHSQLAARFDAAREGPPPVEAERMLADLGARLFGLTAAPPRLGRFVIERRLGAGGMGIVYVAHDAELERKVAVKLLRLHGPDRDGRGAARLLREARALARVDHPHVVAVHEVGDHDGAVFLAMELIEGVTFAEWQRGRGWREVVEVYLQAGRGLAAAHAAGVVHRDFKPTNVIVGADDRGRPRARVVDFGLARAGDEDGVDLDVTDAAPPTEGTTLDEAPNDRLTATGTLLGTPAYMAPEQLAGRRADARSDQFSFALALYEGVFGQRAFAGDDLDDLRAAVLAGRRRPLAGARSGPRWLLRVLDRALALAPARRYPSMPALLAELERGLSRRRRVGLTFGALALGIGGAFAGTWAASPSLCSRGGDVMAEVWHDDARRGPRRLRPGRSPVRRPRMGPGRGPARGPRRRVGGRLLRDLRRHSRPR